MTSPTEHRHELESGDRLEISHDGHTITILAHDTETGTTAAARLTVTEAMAVGGKVWGCGLGLAMANLGQALTPGERT